MFSPPQCEQCFLCSRTTSTSVSQENVEVDSGRRKENRIRRNHKYKGDFEQSSSSSNAQSQNAAKRILLKYLVARCEDEELKDKLTTTNSPIKLCNECARMAKEVQDLHLKLESIQMMLIDKLKQVKELIVQNSKTFREWSEGRRTIKDEDDMTGLTQMACQFHTFFANKKDTNEVDVPLIFLGKFVGRKTFPEIMSSTSKSNEMERRHINICQPKMEYIPGEIQGAGIGNSSVSDSRVPPVDKPHSEKIENRTQVKEEVTSDVDEYPASDVGFYPVTVRSDSEDKVSPKLSSKPTTRKPKNTSKPQRNMIKCDSCSSSFRSAFTLSKHKMSVHGHSKVKCDLCPPSPGRYFVKASGLHDHLRIFHPQEDAKKFSCSHCPEEFPLKWLRNRHERKIHEEKKFFCDKCDFVAIAKHRLENHSRTVHSTLTIICEVCGFTAKHEDSLRRHHMRKHDPEYQMKHKVKSSVKNFECSLCPKKFWTSALFNQHMITHSDETPFHCDVCGQAFKYKRTFIEHMLSQHGQGSANHNCSQCSKSFTTKFKLELHMFIHTEEKKFECHLCGTRLKRQNILQRHMKNVHGIGATGEIVKKESRGKWVCQECGKDFYTSHCLTRHLLVHAKGGTTRNRKRKQVAAGVANLETPADQKS